MNGPDESTSLETCLSSSGTGMEGRNLSVIARLYLLFHFIGDVLR
jgi:hypothetical protein